MESSKVVTTWSNFSTMNPVTNTQRYSLKERKLTSRNQKNNAGI
jgi:hypothetical protein